MESLAFVLGLAASFVFALALSRAFLESIVRLARLGEDMNRSSFQRTARGAVRDVVVAGGPIAT